MKHQYPFGSARKSNRATFLLLACLYILLPGTVPADSRETTGFVDVSHMLDFVRSNSGLPDEGISGVAWIDYDNDDDLDLFIANGAGFPNALFRNDDGHAFTNVAAQAGVENGLGNSGALAGDIDNDGCTDLFLTGVGGIMGPVSSPTRLYVNNCDGTFSDISDSAGVPGADSHLMAAFGDINNDGYLDLFVTSPGSFATMQQHPSKLYLNNGDRTFTDISTTAGVDTSLGSCVVGFSDYDKDGLIDIFVGNCNDLLFTPTPFELFKNNGDLTFTNSAPASGLASGGAWMSFTPGDYDNDGDVDLFSSNAGVTIDPDFPFPHALWENEGDGMYNNVASEAGVSDWEWGWGASFIDADNDGDEDLVMAGSFPFLFDAIGPGKGNPGRLFTNNGDRSFALTAEFGLENQFSSGLAVADFDKNGFEDVVIVTSSFLSPGKPVLLKNTGNDNHWLTIRTVGTDSNRGGVGAKIRVRAGKLRLYKEVYAGSSFISTNSPWPTFGLGKYHRANIKVSWPSGREEYFFSTHANQMVTLTEGTGFSRRDRRHQAEKHRAPSEYRGR